MSTKSESACTKLNNSLAKSIDYNVSSINHALNCSLETNNTNVIQRSSFIQRLLNYFDIDRYIL